MNLCRPLDSKVVQLSGPRSDFILRPKRPDLDAWGCVYAVRGCMRALLSSVPLDLELLELAHAHAVKMMEAPNVSGLQLLALILDELHEGSQMLSEVITYPMQAFPLLKKKLWALGYHHEEGEGQFVLNVLEQMKLKWMETCRCMFEFSLPPLVGWRVGLHFGKACIKDVGYPGEDPFSFGIGHDHHVYYNGTATFYEHYDQRIPYNGIGLRTFAILIDFYKGSLHLGCGKTLLPPAFGYGASHFSSDVQNTQAQMIKTRLLIPMFALEGKSMERTKDQIEMRVNFGLYPFQCTIPSQSINALLALKDPTTFETKSVFEPPKLDAKDKEEEEKLYLAFEKTQFRTAMVSEEDRSWSQFPPSVYRRSLAATKIQRAFRIFRGRKWRKQLWITQTNAVIKIQRAARKRLAILHQKQYLAAKIIQKNWRKSMYLQLRLMSKLIKKTFFFFSF
ncbi:hypothetical protein HMI56_002096 [Coelomomyces lativittatus]|nr:hypothetical protein HMI56_002096 [Coelomomyces lativittatus]